MIWPTKITNDTPDLQRVHYTLAYGTLDDFRNLVKDMGHERVKSTFQRPYRGTYSKARFGLYRAYFDLPSLDPKNYVKFI